MNNSDLAPYYKILGLKPGASLSEVKQAYRNLVKTQHPDLFVHDTQIKHEAEERFKKIIQAYKELEKFYSSPNQTSHATNYSTNTANTSNTSNIPTSIRSYLRQHLGSIIAIVVVVNIANVVALVFMASRNSSPKNNSSPPITSNPPITFNPPITSSLLQPQQCRIIAPTVGTSARLFSQPSKDTYTGRRIPKDTKVSFIRGMREFVEIRLSDRTKGWVFNDQIYPCTPGSNSTAQTASISLQPQQCLIISPRAGRGARLFTQPSRDTFTGRRIPKNTKGSFIRETREFVEVRLSDQTQGWVFNDQIYPCTPSSNSIPPIASSAVEPRQCRVIAPTAGSGARLFTQPSRETDTGTRIPQDTRVSFIGGMREFVEIELSDRTKGWVFNDQIYPCTSESNSSPPIASSSLQPQQCRLIAPTAGRGARLFTQPSQATDTGKRIPQDTKVSFIREMREFAEISLSDRTNGWVFNDQIRPCTQP